MARVLMISANSARAPYAVFPLGMAMVADAVRAHGHEVRQWDYLAADRRMETLSALVEEFDPDVVGISIRNIDNADAVAVEDYTDLVERVVRTVRWRTEAWIVLGGAGYTILSDVLLENTGADYGIIGEGERAFPSLIASLVEDDPPNKPYIRAARPVSGAEIRTPRRDPDLMRYYLAEGAPLNVQTKRGCPYRCAYCAYSFLEGFKYRFRPPEDVAEEVAELVEQWGAPYVAFTDSVFNDREGHWREVAEALVRRGVQTPWMAFFRPDDFSREDVELLRRAGLHSVEWGTDATSDRTLIGLQKDFSWAQVEASNRLFAEAGIACAHFVMFGGPGETRDTVRQGIENLERLEDCVVFAFEGVRILPVTRIQDLAIETGQVSREDDLLQARFYHAPEAPPEFIDRELRRAFAGRPDRIYPPSKDVGKVRALHKMGRAGPGWDLLLPRHFKRGTPGRHA